MESLSPSNHSHTTEHSGQHAEGEALRHPVREHGKHAQASGTRTGQHAPLLERPLLWAWPETIHPPTRSPGSHLGSEKEKAAQSGLAAERPGREP